jgi:PAS domain S-box-containing protein
MTAPGSQPLVPPALRPVEGVDTHADRAGRTAADGWAARVPAIGIVRRIGANTGAELLRPTYVSDRVEGALGYTAREILEDGDLWSSRIHPDDLGRVLATWRRPGAPGERRGVTYRMTRRDGRVIRVREEAGIADDPDPSTASWYGVVTELTDEATASELREAEEKYRLLVEQIPAVTYIDEVPPDDPTDLSPMYISPQIEQLLGYRPDEWVADPSLWERVTHHDDIEAADAGARRAFEDGTPLSIEYRMIARDGRTVWVREEASLYRDEAGAPKFWQGLYVDITELKRAEDELNNALTRERDASARLRALDEMKNTFLQAVSHDLRTPLAAILGIALTLERDDLDLEREEVQDLATRIAANSRKLDRMVADLLDLDRLSRGIMEPKLRLTDIGALVRRLVDQTEAGGHRQIDVSTNQVAIPVDASKIERIVENLLANAVRHTPDSTRVWVRVAAEDDGALITVEDDGPGIPEELREAIFDAFRQGPSSSSHSPGAGVGLALVARFAELHGGRAWVEQRAEGGASFRVFLPEKTEDPIG